MAKITVYYPKRIMRRIDKAAANIGTHRPHVMRAIIRQAIENEAAVIRTKWGRSHVV
jgi:metal-responsive CopG/Arc/MetJ family transcriptional regulator